MKLSIIIPVYNVEKYIEKCLLSCVHQDLSLTDYEIIVVNDGTKDKSLLMAEEIASSYSNISIISQDNQGLSVARNNGLRHAQGEYVWFIDSDDWIKDNSLSIVLSYCVGCDVIALNYKKVFEVGTSSKIIRHPVTTKMDGCDILNTMRFITPAQFYIYRRDFLNKNQLKFYEGIYHEDMEFTPRMLYCAQSIQLIEEPIYYYLIRQNSITTMVNSKKSFDLIKVASSLDRFSRDINEKDCFISFSYYISIAINNALSLSAKYTKEDKNRLVKMLVDNKFLTKRLCSSPLLKNKIEGILFRLFPSYCIYVYQLLQKLNR